MSHAKSVDPDQTPCLAASDLGLHCFPSPIYGAQGIHGLNAVVSSRIMIAESTD